MSRALAGSCWILAPRASWQSAVPDLEDSAVAVFSHFDSCRRDDKGRSGGNIETVGAVAAGAYDFKDLQTRVGYRSGMFPHGNGTAGNFINRFRLGALGGKGCQESCVLGGSRFAAHDFIHYIIGFFIGEITFSYDFLDCFFNHFMFLHFYF